MSSKGQEIAVAYVSITPSMQGIQGAVAKELGGVDKAFGAAGKSSGERFSSALNKSVEAAMKVATGVVAAGGVAMGVALTKGLGRLNAIDTAKAKLRGLGNDADTVSVIMKNATASVRGTAYGLDEAATTAAGAVAAGIKPGQQLEGTLKAVANVAAASGRGMDEMGAVFNQVAAGGKAYTEQIKQVAYAGLPIWQKLAEVLGTTEDQVQKMASSGEIDFDTFQKAAALAAGSVATEMGTTLPGALQNAMAAVSRFGANLWKGFEEDDGSYTGVYSKLTGLVIAFQNAMGPIEDMGAKIGDMFGRKVGPLLDGVTNLLNRFGDAGDNAGAKFGPLLNALGPGLAMFAALGAGGIAPLLTKIPVLGSMLGGVSSVLGAIGGPAGIAAAGLFALTKVDPGQMIAGFTQMQGQIPAIFDSIQGVIINFAVNMVPSFVEGITTNLPILVQGIVNMVGTIATQLGALLPTLVGAAVMLFQGLVQGLVEVLPVVLSGVVDLVTKLLPVIVGMVPVLVGGAVQLFGSLVQGLAQVVGPLISAVVALIPVLVETLVSLVGELIEGAITLFTALVDAIPVVLPVLLEGIVALLPEILGAVVSLIPALMDGAIQLFTALVQALPIILPVLIQAVIDMIPVVIDALLSTLDALVQGAVTLFTGIIDALPIIIPELIDAVIAIGPQLVQALIDMVPLLFQAGKDLIGGLISGIGDMASGAVEAIKGVGSSMLDGIKGFFGIASPSKVMADIGGFLDSGLAGGIGKGTGSVAAMTAMSKQVTAVTDALQASVAAAANAVAQQVNRIIASLQSLMQMMSGAFRSSVTAQLNQLANLFRTVLPSATDQMTARMRTGLTGLQTWFAGGFKNALVAAINAIKSAFLAVPGAVTTSWAKIKTGTADPANYVISTVYMNGIRSAVNSIRSAVGLSASMPAVRSIGYASGTGNAVLPGYTPGRDIYDFYNPRLGRLRLGGGEGILRPEVVKALGGADTINMWNQSRGRGIGSTGDRGYKSGGIIDFLNMGSSGWSVNSKHPDFEGRLFENLSGGIKGLVTDPARAYAGRSGGGMFGQAMGQSMVNMASAYAPMFARALDAHGGSGAGLVASARKAIGVPYVWGGSTIPPGLDCSGLVFWALQQLGKRVPRLTAAGYQNMATPVGSPRAGDLAFWGSPANHVAIMSGANSMVHAPRPGTVVSNASLYGSPTFGRLKYDQGGWLRPGLTLAENRTGKPEPVFTSDQWDRMNQTPSFPDHLILRIGERDFKAFLVDETGAAGSSTSVLGAF